MGLEKIFKTKTIIPYVMHKVVMEEITSWEDIKIEILKELILEIKFNQPHLDNKKIDHILTFDDGFESDYEIVFPILKKNNLMGIFFIVPDWIGLPGYLNWRQVNEMVLGGMEIGSHSLTHRPMNQLNLSQIKNEFLSSRNIIEDKIGNKVNMFSYPYGIRNKMLDNLALESGYQFLWGSNHGVINKSSVYFTRNSINSKTNLDEIKKIIYPILQKKSLWYIEDFSKYFLKIIFGQNLYKNLRNCIFNDE